MIRRFFPVLYVNACQAAHLRRQQEIIETQQQAMERMGQTLGRLRSDVELLAACIPTDKRDLALSLVRDRHRIADLDEIEEVGGA